MCKKEEIKIKKEKIRKYTCVYSLEHKETKINYKLRLDTYGACQEMDGKYRKYGWEKDTYLNIIFGTIQTFGTVLVFHILKKGK